MARVLVVAAHPDDEVLGAGATIARHVADGDAVSVLLLGEGITSRYGATATVPPSEVDDLRAAARRANEALGVNDVSFAGLADNRFDSVNLLDLVRIVERAVAEAAPAVVYTHHPGDLNIDHQLTFRAVLTATRPTPGFPVTALYSFEVPSSTEWAFGRLGGPFAPALFVDVTTTLDVKLAALSHYDIEMRPPPHARSFDAVRAAATRWGAVVGRTAAEAFEVVRLVR